MNTILRALAHHLNKHTPHNWEPLTNHAIQTTIQTPIKWSSGTLQLITRITITHEDNTLQIEHTTGAQTHTTTIDLLDPDFLHKIHHIIQHP